MFGGPPPAASGSSSNLAALAAVPIADVDDSFLDAFALPPRQQHQGAQQQQQQEAAGGSLQSGDFGDFLGPQGYGAAAAAAAAGTSGSPPSAGSGGSSSGRQGAPAAAAPGPTSSFGYEARPAAGAAASGQSRYKVFDFVDAQRDSPATGRPAGAVAAASAGSGGSPLEDGLRMPGGGGDSSSQQAQQQQQGRRPVAPTGGTGAGAGALHPEAYSQQQQQGPKEVVSDLGQKAAKALQSGTKWFMKASKTLVTQVQQRLDHGGAVHSGAVHGGAGGGAVGPRPAQQQQQQQGPGEPAPFHYDWAAQLARISPGSRSAALGAMTEDDRLAVQVGCQCLLWAMPTVPIAHSCAARSASPALAHFCPAHTPLCTALYCLPAADPG
jgi:hypothetical protein